MTDSSTAVEDNLDNLTQDKKNLALLLSFDPNIRPSQLELAIQNDELIDISNEDKPITNPFITISNIGSALKFIADTAKHGSIGLIAYYDTQHDTEIIRAVLKRVTQVLPSNVTVAHYIDTDVGIKLEKVEEDSSSRTLHHFRPHEVDPLYGHVKLMFKEGGTVSWVPGYVIKATHDDLGSRLSISDLARINEEAMAFYKFGVPTIADNDTGRVFMEHVGLISYDLIREIRRKTNNIKNKHRPGKQQNPMIDGLQHLKNILIYTQLSTLAKHQANPFTPIDDDGEIINVTPDVIGYYRETLKNSFGCKNDHLRREAFDRSIDAFITMLSGSADNVVRYIDMYQRNHGIQHPDVKNHGDLQSMLSNLSIQNQTAFVENHFKQVDVHRILRTSLDLEDFWHVISDPALKLSLSDELAWYHVFLGIKELNEEYTLPEKERNDDKIKQLESAITTCELIPHEFSDKFLERNKPDVAYFLAMKIFRTTRWFDLIGGRYIPKYEARRAEASAGFDLLLRDDVVKSQEPALQHFMGGTGKTPPGRLKYIRFITDALTRQDAQEILKLGITFDPSQTDGLETVFDSNRRIAEAIARINTLSACSRWLESYRNDLAGYRNASYEAFDQALDLTLNSLSSREISLHNGLTRYSIRKAPPKNVKNNSLVLYRNDIYVSGIQDHITALREISSTMTPSSEMYYRTVQLMTLRFLYHTRQLNVGGK